LTFASLHYQQKRAEAILPLLVKYVATQVISSIVVGAIIYFLQPDGTRSEGIIDSVEPDGQVNIEQRDCSDDNPFGVLQGTRTNGTFINAYPSPPGTTQQPPTGFVMQDWVAGSLVDVLNRLNEQNSQSDYCEYLCTGSSFQLKCFADGVNNNSNDVFASEHNIDPDFVVTDIPGGMGNKSVGTIDDFPIEFYDFLEDVPLLPDCFDGIQNQDETGIDCGGVCELNFGLTCFAPPLETCSDGIMNQDETGIDFGGVCGTGNPVAPPPGNLIDDNVDGIDDISGLDSGGNVPVAVPGTADGTTYDASLPGDVSDVGETDWSGLITGYLASNPLVLLATGSQINVTGATCSLPLTLFGKSMSIDFCSLDWMVDLFGSFVLGLMAIRAVFIAMGV
jgi:hypothetical protein